MIHPTVTKGRITVPDRFEYREFVYNPSEIDDGKEIEWGTAKVAGASHPIYQAASGGERPITFDLFLDADRKRILRNGKLDLTNELKWYRSLLYPLEYSGAITKAHPPTVVFTFGTMWQSVTCIVRRAAIKVTYFSPDLRPIRATVSMALAEVVNKSQVYTDVLSGGDVFME